MPVAACRDSSRTTRRDRVAFAILLASLVAPAAVRGQSGDAPPADVETDSDPTRPVFISIRPEFYDVDDDVARRALIVRYDATALRRLRLPGGAPGMVLRFELPLMTADIRGDHAAGVGDTYAQVFVVPYATGTFAWATGSGFVLPTANDRSLGGGAWVVAPVAAPVWRAPHRLFLVKVQDFMKVAGDRTRPDINYLLVTPTLIHVIAQRWWVLADSETKTAWTDGGATSIKSGLQLGRRVARGVGAWVKPEAWWGPNREGRWTLKFGLVWYQR